MEFYCINSGSKANGYLMKASDGQTLIIEAGCHLSNIYDAMDHDISGVVGCIISHCHLDHFQWTEKYMDAGIECHMNQYAMETKKVTSHHAHLLESGKQVMIGNFKVKPLEVDHDIPCLAFMIDHPESGRTFFITDSSFCRWNLSAAKIQNWLVEANYDDQILESNFLAGTLPSNVYERVKTGHFSLANCKDFFLANDLSHTIRIILLHLSQKNGNASLFTKEIQKVTGKEVLIAKPGLRIENFGPSPF